ncbi:MAG: T9SS type A sorting domain-containing protein [Bacteroidia bacterium]
MKFLLLGLTILFQSNFIYSQILLNEVLVNPPGTDNPFEFIEIKGDPGTTINQIYLCVFEGDSASAGNCDLSIPLQNITLGSNGLLFVGTTIGYPDLPSETVVLDELAFAVPGGYLENGSTTFALIFSTVNIVEDADYDTNNDGILDLPLGAVLLDAVGWSDGDQFAKIYGGVVLTQSVGTPDGAVRFYENNTPLSKPAWYNGDLVDLNSFDLLEISDNFPSGEETGITPGNYNIPNNGVGISDVSISQVSIYPNPATDFVYTPNTESFSTYSLFSADGKLVESGNIHSDAILVNRFDSGLYFLELRNNENRYLRTKLVIRK